MESVKHYWKASLLLPLLLVLLPVQAFAFVFTSTGDAQMEPTRLSGTVSQMSTLNPAFVIFNGDLENDGVTDGFMNTMTTALGGLYNKTFLIRGNHDNHVTGSAALWQTYFTNANRPLPAGVTNYVGISPTASYLTYSFDYGNSRFIGVDVPGDVGLLNSTQLTFIDSRLTDAESKGMKHAFMYWHGPEYCVESVHCSCSTATASCTPASLITIINKHPILHATFHGHEHILGWTHMSSSRVPSLTREYEQFITSPAGGWTYYPSTYPARLDFNYNPGSSQVFGAVDVSDTSFTVNLYKVGTATPVWTHTFVTSGGGGTPTPTPTPTQSLTPTPGNIPTCTGVRPTGNPTIPYSQTSYTVYADGVANASSVTFWVWSEVNGQDDLVGYTGSNMGGGTWSATFNPQNHNSTGQFQADVWLNSGFVYFCKGAPFIRATSTTPTPTPTQPPSGNAVLVRTIDSSKWVPPSPDTSGIVYLSHLGRLLITDSEVEELSALYAGTNLWDITLTGTIVGKANTLAYSNEPTGVAYNSANRHIYITDDDQKRVYDIGPGTDGIYFTSDDTRTFFSTTGFGSNDPEGATVANGELYIADGTALKIFHTSLTGTLIGSFAVNAQAPDPEGVAYYGGTNTLYIADMYYKRVVEYSMTGAYIRTININAANPVNPGDLAFAPTSSTTDSQYNYNLYVVDRGIDNGTNPGENDGKVYELSIPGLPPYTGGGGPTPTPTSTLTPTPTLTPTTPPSGRVIKYYGVDRGNPITDANYSLLAAHAVKTVVVDMDVNGNSADWLNAVNLATKYNFNIVIWPSDWDDPLPNCMWESPFHANASGDYIWEVKPLLDAIGGNPHVIGIVNAHEPMWSCIIKISDMATSKTQLKNYIYSKFGRTDFKVWNYVDNITDLANGKITDYTGPADAGKIMDVAVTWQHCFGGAEGTCPQAQQKILNDRAFIKNAGLEGKVELVYLFQTFAQGSGYRMPTLAEMQQWDCTFINTGALDGFMWYTWGACWYTSDLYCPAATHPNQGLWPEMNRVYNACINVGPTPPPPPPTPPPSTPTPTVTPTPGAKRGDANGDGKVDEADYSIWLQNYGLASGGMVSKGDFDQNGKVDGIDYVIWLLSYGS